MSTKSGTLADRLVGVRIRTLRLQLRMSQTQLAEKLGLTFQQVQKYEKGFNRVGAGRLLEIARIFKVPVQTLFPQSEEVVAQSDPNQGKMSEFLLSAEGQRLCRAFLQLGDQRLRRRIIEFVEGVATDPS